MRRSFWRGLWKKSPILIEEYQDRGSRCSSRHCALVRRSLCAPRPIGRTAFATLRECHMREGADPRECGAPSVSVGLAPPLAGRLARSHARPGCSGQCCSASRAAMRSSSAHTSAMRPEITRRPASAPEAAVRSTRTTRRAWAWLHRASGPGAGLGKRLPTAAGVTSSRGMRTAAAAAAGQADAGVAGRAALQVRGRAAVVSCPPCAAGCSQRVSACRGWEKAEKVKEAIPM